MTERRSPVRLVLFVAALCLLAGTGCNLSSTSSGGGGGGNSGVLQASVANLQFGTIPTASRKALSETVTNSGAAAVTISQIASSAAVFSVNGVNPPVTLSPGQAVSFEVAFAPQSGGSETAQLAIGSNASNPTLSVSLSGTGMAPGSLAVSPATMNFGSVTVGSSKSQTATLSATNGPVVVSATNLNNSEFSVSGLSLPVTMAAGSNAAFTVTFTPQASGVTSGTLSFTASASNSGVSESLSGTGTVPASHSVTLNWNPSTSTVDGYNIYRGLATGGPYMTRINSALDTSTTAVDNTVESGTTYYYVVRAVAGTQESANSNQATAVIP